MDKQRHFKSADCSRSKHNAVAVAVCAALYGLTPRVQADTSANSRDAGPSTAMTGADASDKTNDVLQEITVTATRRNETRESVPYAIDVITPSELEAAGVKDVASLAQTVPGLSIYDYGARFSGSTPPIIRGINATPSPFRAFRSFEQAPVGTYIGNSPIEGYFELDDLNRVEVLKGPQGTLYGAGSIGGALRMIPNSANPDKFEAAIDMGASKIKNADGTGGEIKGLINIPFGDGTWAFRAAGKYDYTPGWIDAYGLYSGTNQGISHAPTLANPSEPLTSSPIYNSYDNWDWQKTFSGRSSLVWKPGTGFNAELAFLYANAKGDGGPTVNPDYPGGTSPWDPNSTLPAGGTYKEFAFVDEPWTRTTKLTSLDMSYDLGFATVSSTSSYQTTAGSLIQDETADYSAFGTPPGAFLPYYAGVPSNPRFVYPFLYTDHAESFSQELRIVSTEGHAIDYVAGVFFQHQIREGNWYTAIPGSPEYVQAQGKCTAYPTYATFYTPPNCLVAVGRGDLTFEQLDEQAFEDRSVFGELKWHFMPHGQLTFGGRYYNQSFTDTQLYNDFTFDPYQNGLPYPEGTFAYVAPTPHSSPAHKFLGKVNPSYEWADHQYVYAEWSQGFRRGGANSVPRVGPFRESPELYYYQPDTTNNYEMGLKGRLQNGLSYTADVFYVDWNKPQIFDTLPSGNLAVFNAPKARSTGFELEAMGPLFVPGVSYSVGYSYTDAQLTQSFALPANNGSSSGTIVPGLITGTSGAQMPGSPKSTLTLALVWDYNLLPGYALTSALNGVYHSRTALQATQPGFQGTPIQYSSDYKTVNLNVALKHSGWQGSLYSTNVFNTRSILAPPSIPNGIINGQVNKLTNDYVVNQPRTIGFRVGYRF